MIDLPGSFRFLRGQRAFEPIYKISVLTDAIMISITAVRSRILPPPNSTFAYVAKSLNLDVALPLVGSVFSLAHDIQVDGIELQIRNPTAQRLELSQTGKRLSRLTELGIPLTVPIFVEFFERYRPWIETIYKGDPHNWPSVLNFARLIRNFAVHNNGYVRFANPNSPTGSWRNLNYRHGDTNRLAIGQKGDMLNGDLIVLLMDFSSELDSLGCPLI